MDVWGGSWEVGEAERGASAWDQTLVLWLINEAAAFAEQSEQERIKQ